MTESLGQRAPYEEGLSVFPSTTTVNKGGRPRKEPTRTVGVRIPVRQYEAMSAYAAEKNTTVADLFRTGWTHLQLAQSFYEQGDLDA